MKRPTRSGWTEPLRVLFPFERIFKAFGAKTIGHRWPVKPTTRTAQGRCWWVHIGIHFAIITEWLVVVRTKFRPNKVHVLIIMTGRLLVVMALCRKYHGWLNGMKNNSPFDWKYAIIQWASLQYRLRNRKNNFCQQWLFFAVKLPHPVFFLKYTELLSQTFLRYSKI